ncbi:putative PadR family transcriptional regulator [Streptomyces sp. NBRC 110611]|uniref:PadR family transcriptional regulator n=1 Tax=Streptomyces sp. NBRC 110611 TaxID=1621259 RepID=UPI000855F268|nr:PadR family transcriptional regulator [Streptomyces sp. NBRC 110611]GAU69484.1 putative PadR family transcriptional regulator [Streptomyces sp. NBRC 110611]
MSLPHAILTALLEKPSSGLELTRRFDRSIGYFWPATHQQIYRELGKLEQAGFIRVLPSRQPSRGQKKEFEVLPAGRAELTAWASGEQEAKPVRNALVLRLRAAAVVGRTGLDEELRRHLALHRRQLAEYEEIEDRDFGAAAEPEDRLRQLVLRAGIGLETFWVQWLEEALTEVEGMTEGAGAVGGTGTAEGTGMAETEETAGGEETG